MYFLYHFIDFLKGFGVVFEFLKKKTSYDMFLLFRMSIWTVNLIYYGINRRRPSPNKLLNNKQFHWLANIIISTSLILTVLACICVISELLRFQLVI